MLYLILALIIAGAITALLTWVFSRGKEESPIIQPPAGDCGSCDGNDERCEMECMMEAATQAIEYYEDEELDDFRGRASDSYTEQEVERFAEVLYPDSLKDELLLMMGK